LPKHFPSYLLSRFMWAVSPRGLLRAKIQW
jgi:hypothetical protein